MSAVVFSRLRVHWLALGTIVIAEIIAIVIDYMIFRGRFTPAGFVLPADLDCFMSNGALWLPQPSVSPAAVAKLCRFMYPPPFLLLAAPLAWLSPVWVFIFWSAVTNICLIAAARLSAMSWPAIGFGIIAPANLFCLIVGQTGSIVSAVLLLSLTLAEHSPVMAGIMAGCLVIKPQFGILLPICFLASNNWRAILAACLTACAVCLLSLLLFGSDAWQHFFHIELGAAHSELNEAWPQPFQKIMVSFFILIQSLGFSLRTAFAGQVAATIASICAAGYIWSRPISSNNHPARVAVTFCLIMLATPYAYLYDLPGLAMAILAYTARTDWQVMLPMTLLWIFTSLYIPISMVSFVAGAGFLLALTIYIWPAAVGRTSVPPRGLIPTI